MQAQWLHPIPKRCSWPAPVLTTGNSRSRDALCHGIVQLEQVAMHVDYDVAIVCGCESCENQASRSFDLHGICSCISKLASSVVSPQIRGATSIPSADGGPKRSHTSSLTRMEHTALR